MATSPVIDISHHNPTPDWSGLKDGGVIGVMLKCTESTTYLDPTYYDRWSAAEEAGLCVSSYHFLKGGAIENQMDWFLAKCSPAQGERVCLDHEADATIDDLCQAVSYLWSVRPDLQITIYSGHLIKDQLNTNRRYAELDDTSLWIAQYTSASSPSWPKQQWPQWSLWQWTDSETVPGISAPVDGNKWNGSEENLIKWMSPASDQPAPAPEPVPELPVISITIQADRDIILIVNDEQVSV